MKFQNYMKEVVGKICKVKQKLYIDGSFDGKTTRSAQYVKRNSIVMVMEYLKDACKAETGETSDLCKVLCEDKVYIIHLSGMYRVFEVLEFQKQDLYSSKQCVNINLEID